MASVSEQLASRINFGSITKADDLKKRILFTLLALIVYRFGSYIPIPGIDPVALEKVFERNVGGILGMFDMFAGGALGRMTVFALNIMPYISASIIMQLLTVISPTLEQLKKEGEIVLSGDILATIDTESVAVNTPQSTQNNENIGSGEFSKNEKTVAHKIGPAVKKLLIEKEIDPNLIQ